MQAGEKKIIFNSISIAYVRDLKRLRGERARCEAFHSIIHHYFPLLHRHARQAYLLKEDPFAIVRCVVSVEEKKKLSTKMKKVNHD